MNTENHTTSLLEKLDAVQVESIIWQVLLNNPQAIQEIIKTDELKSLIDEFKIVDNNFDNVEFHYISDVYDISQFYFPFGFRHKKSNIPNVELLADEQVSWNNIFSDKAIFFLDEHKPELMALRKLAIDKYSADVVDQWVGLKEKLKYHFNTTPTLEVYKEFLGDLDWINENSTIIFSLAAGFGNKIKDFVKLLNEKIVFNNDDILRRFKQDSKDIIYAFESNKPGSIHLQLFKERRESIIKSGPVSDRRLLNLYTDCAVIDRVLRINEYFSNPEVIKRLNKQVVFLFLSSTNSVTSFYNHNATIKEHFPTVCGRKLNIFRTNAQIYLDLLTNNKDGDVTSKIRQLYYFLNTRRAADRNEGINDSIRFQERVTFLRNQIEGLGMLKQYFSYTDKFVDAFARLRNHLDLKGLNELVNELEEKLPSTNNVKALYYSLQASKRQSIEYTFYEIIQQTASRIQLPRLQAYRSANDFVIGINHVFPILFYIRDIKYRYILDALVGLIMSPTPETEYNNLKSIITKFFTDNKDHLAQLVGVMSLTSYEDRLLRYLFALILLPYLEENNEYSDSKISLLLMDYISSDIRDLKEVDKSILIDVQYREQTLLNILYFQTWAHRFIGDYLKAISTAHEGILAAPYDPRFYHGLSLAYYCKYRAEHDLKDLIAAKFSIEDAVAKYEINENIESTYFGNKLHYGYSYASSVNALLYMNLLIYEQKGNINQDYITEIRLNLLDKKLRNYFGDGDDVPSEQWKTKQFPEFLYTESYLEYLEALDYKKSGHTDEVDSKIKTAKINLNNCIVIEGKRYSDVHEDSVMIHIKMYKELSDKLDNIKQ